MFSELRHVCLFLGEIMCSVCVSNELLEPFLTVSRLLRMSSSGRGGGGAYLWREICVSKSIGLAL